MDNPGRLLTFDSEDLLQQALMALLARIPHVHDIQLMQGAGERGKDIVFKYSGPFDETVVCACVVKNTGLTGKVAAGNSAHTVVIQARQALLTPYIDSMGSSVRVHRVFVITPARLSAQAIEAVSGELQERLGQIHFLHGDELVRVFQRYWRDFLADEAAALMRYGDAMRDTLEDQRELKTVALLYPEVSIGRDLGSLHYVETAFRISVRQRDVFALIPGLPDHEFFSRDRSFNEIDRLRLTLGSVSRFAMHLDAWGYRVASPLHLPPARFSDLAEDFLSALSRWWMALDRLREAVSEDRATVVEQNDVTRTRESAAGLLQRLRGLLASTLADFDRDLRFAHSLAAAGDVSELGFPAGERFLAYQRASDCLTAFAAETEAPTADVSVSRDYHVSRTHLRSAHGVFLIVGPAGFGKTSFCRWSALEDLRLWRADESEYVPVYVRLGLVDQSLTHERDLLRRGLHTALLSDVDWQAVERGEVALRLYLDGLDEIADERQREIVIRYAVGFSSAHPKWQILITSRDYVRASWLTGFPRMNLDGFERRHVAALASALLTDRPFSAEAFMSELDAQLHLASLSTVPLLATLMILIFGNTGDLPSRRATLYTTFVDLLCGGWDLAKGIQRHVDFPRDAKVAILTRLAVLAHATRRRTISSAGFPDAALAAAPRLFARYPSFERHAIADRLLSELLGDGLLGRAGTELQFAHFSFQEFLVARDLAQGGARTRLESAMSEFLAGDDWWREVLYFFVGLSADPERVADWIQSEQRAVADDAADVSDSRRGDLLAELQRSFPHVVAGRV